MKKRTQKLLKEVEAEIAILQPQEAKIQAEIAENSRVIKDAEKDIRIIKSGLGTEQSKIPNLETELEQLVENFEQNKKDADEVKRKSIVGCKDIQKNVITYIFICTTFVVHI